MVRFGVMIFPTDTSIQPVEMGRAVEERGFESLWFPEHSHIPVSRETPWGGRSGAPPLPEQYWRTHDQLIGLAAVAATTSRIKLGTGITLVAQRDPIWLAKEVASLDVISRGRVLFGVGYGWNKEEMGHHGVRYRERRQVLREKVLAMKALWTEDEAEYHGAHVRFQPSWSWPKPLQEGGPPVIMGGAAGPKTLAHIVEFCDGWMPLRGRHDPIAGAAAVRRAAEEAGRDPATIELGVSGSVRSRGELERLSEAGFTRVVFGAPSAPEPDVLAYLDDKARLVEEWGTP